MIEGFDSNVLQRLAHHFKTRLMSCHSFRQNGVDVILSHFALGRVLFAQQGVPGLRWFEHDSAR